MEKSKLIELFKMQNVLRDHIGYEGPDKKEKMLLALLVEIGECANEWRGFKYWSTDQEPRTAKLLEEYVDGIHFILDYGLEIGIEPGSLNIRYSVPPSDYTTQVFLKVQELVFELRKDKIKNNKVFQLMKYEELLNHYLRLGKMLGFSEDDVFYAYVEKNRINHKRQNEGY